jgi:hypothetical protein
LKYAGASKDLMRKLQRYLVNINPQCFKKLFDYKYIDNINGYWFQTEPLIYQNGLGLLCDEKDWTFGNSVT